MGNNWKLMGGKRGKKKREEMELPANVRRGLLAHSEGLSWIESAKVANLTPHAMRQWRKHPDAENFINHAINSSLEESLGSLAQAQEMMEIDYGCVYKRSSKPVMKGSRVETIEQARKEYKELLEEGWRKTSIYNHYF